MPFSSVRVKDTSIYLMSRSLDQISICAHNYPNCSGITYLVPQAVNEGSPTHPSYPSGHAVQNGAFATVLKVRCR